MKVVVVEPMRRPYEKEIDSCLAAYQEVVDGYIEEVYPFEEDVCLICNEEGKINGSMANRALLDENGKIQDIIFGTFFIVANGEEDWESLTEEQIDKYIEKFWGIEYFFRVDGEITRIVG